MKYLFILGRNPELSRQEVLCDFKEVDDLDEINIYEGTKNNFI